MPTRENSNANWYTGITEQDGSYLTEILLERGYEVHGLVRPASQKRQALNHPLRPRVTLHVGDISDLGRLIQILASIKVDEVYHLAAQSHVAVSFENPLLTGETNAMGTLRLLEAMRILELGKTTRFYNVSSCFSYLRHCLTIRSLGEYCRALRV